MNDHFAVSFLSCFFAEFGVDGNIASKQALYTPYNITRQAPGTNGNAPV